MHCCHGSCLGQSRNLGDDQAQFVTYTPFYILNMLDLRRAWTRASRECLLIERSTSTFSCERGYLASRDAADARARLSKAYLLATTPQKVASILMIFVLLPFWTSLLVRTTSWTILMQDGGVFSQFLNISGLTWLLNLLGLAEGPPQLYKTRFATVVAMTQIQLPFTLLPIYSVMKTISPTYMRAAKSLGGTPLYSFLLRVYLPQPSRVSRQAAS